MLTIPKNKNGILDLMTRYETTEGVFKAFLKLMNKVGEVCSL